MTQDSEASAVDYVREIERRQDEVLFQLDQLEQRIAALLAEFAPAPARSDKAA